MGVADIAVIGVGGGVADKWILLLVMVMIVVIPPAVISIAGIIPANSTTNPIAIRCVPTIRRHPPPCR